jgi:FkbM family methyltransferase
VLAPLAESLTRLYARAAFTGRGGYRLVRLVRRARPRERWRGVFRTPDGRAFELDLATYPDCCMAYGLYELETARLITRLLRPGDHFVDGGANLGYFTVLAAGRVGANGRVDAFEPDPLNRQRLLENLGRNGSPECVRVHPQALGDHEGVATLYRPAAETANHGMSSLVAGKGNAGDRFDVTLTTLDAALGHATPRLVKLDLEGGEAQAVEGMQRLLATDTPPHLIVEHSPGLLAGGDEAFGTVIRRILQLQPRYHVRIIDFPSRELPASLRGLRERGQVNLHFFDPRA